MTNHTAREVMVNELVQRLENNAIAEAFETVDRMQQVLAAAGYKIVQDGAVSKEREACADFVLSLIPQFASQPDVQNGLTHVAAAIRARGKG